MVRAFLYSAGLLLSLTAVAKFVSAAGSAHILKNPEPILGIPFATVFWVVGGIEIIVALVCFLGKRPVLPTALVAWLATNFLIYRLALKWIGYHKPCGCLGNLTDALHISPGAADLAMKIALGYLLLGSYATLLALRRRNSKPLEPLSPGVSGVGA